MIERDRKGEASISVTLNKQIDTDFTDLPFVGRERELNTILSFYHQTFRQDGLSSLWLQGEAGIGKSRLLNVVAAKFIEEGSSVLHLKIYPDTASSLISLIGRTIVASDPERNTVDTTLGIAG
ncbi:MAG: AAA family ATPase [Candidatus Kapaibacterium sp.]